MKKLFIGMLAGLLIFNSANLSSQTPERNLIKYWKYRDRLRKDFMLVGDCQGCSIPASIRAMYSNNTSTFSGPMDWRADAMSNLGWYIGILATEYKLLKDDGESVDETLEELMYALNAVNRIDINAESYPFDPSKPTIPPSLQTLNGFCVRDDVPAGFVEQNMAKWNMNIDKGFYSSRLTDMTLSSGSENPTPVCSDPDPNKETAGNVMSMDNTFNLLLGLAMVKKWLDPNEISQSSFIDGEVAFRQEAINQADRIIHWWEVHDWLNYNPQTESNVCGRWGGNVKALSYFVQKAGLWITGEPYNLFSTPIAIGYPTFEYYNNGSPWTEPEEYKALVLDAIADIGDKLNFESRATNRSLEPLALCRFALHDYKPIFQQSSSGFESIQCLLDHAPCYGPYNYQNGAFATYEWSSSTRIYHPARRGNMYWGDSDNQSGEYPALDYMLIYNLYRIVYEEEGSSVFPQYTNPGQIDILDVYDYPNDVINGYREIIVHSLDLQNGETASYRATESITINPNNFNVSPGSSLDVKIDPTLDGTGLSLAICNEAHDLVDTKVNTLETNVLSCNNYYMRIYNGDWYNLEVYTGLGNLIRSQSEGNINPNEHTVEVSTFGWPTGFYTVKFTAGKNNCDHHVDDAVQVYVLDNGCKREISEQESIVDSQPIESSSLTVHPNPNKGQFTIEAGLNSEEQSRITIIDLVGKIVYDETVNQQSSYLRNVDLSNHSKGVYYIKMQSGGKISTLKIIHQ